MSGLSKTKKNNNEILQTHINDANFSEHAREKFGKTAAAEAEILDLSIDVDDVEDLQLATSADNAKDGNFVDHVNTDEDVWDGKISFEMNMIKMVI